MRFLPPVLAALALLLLLEKPGEAEVHAVPAGGKHLAQALLAAQAGDTLDLAAGNHRAGGLQLPDGIWLTGQGENTRITGRGPRPLFVAENATAGVVLENLLLEGARSRESGGAIRATESNLALRGVTVRECRSKGDGGSVFVRGGRLEITDCQFHNNRATRGGAIAVERGDTESEAGRLVADNVLFANNRAVRGGALASEGPIVVHHGTFVGNQVRGARAEAAVCEARDSLFLRASILVENRGGPAGSGVLVVADTTRLILVWNCFHNNSAGDFAGPVAGFEARRGNQSRDPLFVDASRGDYRLHWLSPMMDRLGGERDFDLTPGDLGWQPRYTPVELLALPADGYLPRGHYTIGTQGARQLLAADHPVIADGTVLKLVSGVECTLASTAGALTVGSERGQRTAIVVDPALGGARSLVLMGSQTSEARFRGMLVYNAPDAYLQFQNLAGLSLDGDDPSLAFEGERGCQLRLVGCEAFAVQGWNFQQRITGARADFTSLMIAGGTGVVRGCVFHGPEQATPFAPLGLIGTTALTVCDNTFATSGHVAVPACRQIGGVAHYRGNQFLQGRSTQLRLHQATAHMGHNARNTFEAGSHGYDQPMIALDSGSLDMACGYNSFENEMANTTDAPFVKADNYTSGSRNWTRNRWEMHLPGYPTCDELALGFIPSWADASNCLVDPNPPVYICSPTGEPLDLWTEGGEAFDDEEWLNANWLFKELIRIYPQDSNAPDASEFIKAIGKKHPDYLEPAKAGLLQGATSSLAVEDDWLSATQYSYAQCVEAYFGDREGAIALLDSCYSKWDEKYKDVATLALLEIDTYPEQGGSSATGNSLDARVARIQRAVDALIAFKPAATAERTETPATQPATFTLGPIYPNPFNPSTRIQLLVAEAAQVEVELYNVLGQRVQSMHSGPLAAGQHDLLLDGSRLATGVYVVRASQGTQIQTAKVLLLK